MAVARIMIFGVSDTASKFLGKAWQQGTLKRALYGTGTKTAEETIESKIEEK